MNKQDRNNENDFVDQMSEQKGVIVGNGREGPQRRDFKAASGQMYSGQEGLLWT